MSEQLLMKFMLQLHRPPKFVERKCRQEWVHSNVKQGQFMVLDKMNGVAGGALENQRRSCSVKQRQNFKGIKDKVTNICKNISKCLQRHLSEVLQEVQVQQVASREEVDMRYLSVFLKDHTIRICFTTSRSGASENSSEKINSCDISVII